MIFLKDPIWFSPFNVIQHANKLIKTLSLEERGSKKFKKVIEAYAVAQMLVGIIESENKEYWMQLVDDKEESPDIRTIKYASKHTKKFDNLEQIDVEVVEYEPISPISIPEFILKTKFSKKKSYDEHTVILCHIGKKIKKAELPDQKEVEKQMKNINSSCQVMLLSATNQEATNFELIQLNPKIGSLIKYKIEDVWKKRKYVGVNHFKKGIRKPSTPLPNEKHYPFEKLGYIPNSKGEY